MIVGSISTPVTNGSGSRKPKNIWIRLIRIRIRNTAKKTRVLCPETSTKMPFKNSIISGVGRACWICTRQRWTPAGWARRCGCRASRTSCFWTRSGGDTSPANRATSSSSSGSRRTRSLIFFSSSCYQCSESGSLGTVSFWAIQLRKVVICTDPDPFINIINSSVLVLLNNLLSLKIDANVP